MRPPRKLLAATALLGLLLACSSTRQRRDASLREQLDAYSLPRPLGEVWPVALRLVNDRGYDLVGKDRLAAGKPEQGEVGKFFARGFETRSIGPGQLAAESDRNGQQVRYRIIGWETGPASCRVEYTAVQGNDVGDREAQTRDVELELALVRTIDAERAGRMLEEADRSAQRK